MWKTFAAKHRDLCVLGGNVPVLTHDACFAVIFHSESVKYTHLLKQALPLQNKQIMWHLHHLGFGHLDSFIPLCFLRPVCFLFWNGNCRELGATLLGILPDGYSVWIRSKFQPRPECVCWTAHCISGDHTGSTSTSKSLCCPLSLSEHLPQGPGSEVQHQRGTCAETNTCCRAANYPSASLQIILVQLKWLGFYLQKQKLG